MAPNHILFILYLLDFDILDCFLSGLRYPKYILSPSGVSRSSYNCFLCRKGVDPDTKGGGGTDWCVTQPFPSGGHCKPLSGVRGRAPEANGFWQNLLQINLKSGLFSVAVYTPNSDPISDVNWLVRRNNCMGRAVRGCTKLVDIRMLNIENACDSYRTGIILLVHST